MSSVDLFKTSDTPISETNTFAYGEGYICPDIQPEDYSSSSTYISWQRFPNSTSTRSHPCEDSVESDTKPPSEPTIGTPPKEQSPQPSSSLFPITKSFSQLNAMHYLEIRHVFEFLNFLMSHLVCKEPDDPVEFLIELIKKCLSYRDCLGEPPLLFTTSHIRSLYRAFDPFERGHITEEQYHEAMKSLGLEKSITPYNRLPTLNPEGCVDEANFLFEAERCLMENLKSMLRIPRIWEENRLVWKKRMKKLAAKEQKSENSYGEMDAEYLGEVEEVIHYPCSPVPSASYTQCPEVEKINCQLEQLFLN